MEMVVCSILLAVVAAVLVPGIQAVNRQRKATRFESFARLELKNQATSIRLSGAFRNDSTRPDLGQWFKDRYPDSKLTVETVADGATDKDSLPALRFTIRTPSTDHMPDLSQSLVVWFDGEEAAE